jgi:hypothetical protein
MQSRWAMSYLRGPLTREEIGLLMKAKGLAIPTGAGRPAAAASGPPVLPAPFQNLHLARYSGQIAEAHVLAKYAVRYKGSDETVGIQAWPLAGATAADALEAEPLPVEESKLTPEAPPGLRYGELPEWLAAGGAKALEKALRDRLPDKLAVTLVRDPVTGSASSPGETRDAFAARLQTAGGGDAAERIRQKLEKKRADLNVREQDVSGRKQEKWVAIGSAVLRNIGLLTGRRRTISGVGSVLSKNRMEDTAEARLEALRAEVAELERQLAEVSEVDPARLREETLVPARGGVKLLRYDLVWVY